MTERPLRVRWLGRVRYRDAHALQHGLFRHSSEDYLLLLEHPHVYTSGVRGRAEHVLVDPASVGAELVKADRGGDVTYHGPGQLVGYPILSVPIGPGSIPDHVHRVEQLVIETLESLGLSDVGRLAEYPGVWVGVSTSNPRKICAIGTRASRGRTMHGFALNVAPDMSMFSHIIPCGIPDRPVTSLKDEGIDVEMDVVVDTVTRLAALVFSRHGVEREIEWQSADAPEPVALEAGLSSRSIDRRLAKAGVDSSLAVKILSRKPDWLRVEAKMGDDYLKLRKTMRTLDLVTVCEEAGCPNIYECWADGTATFMINGDRCTRACGFCLIDTQHPLPLDPVEPDRVARAVEQMGLAYAVVTTVTRDDLGDGGAEAMAETIRAIRRRSPNTQVEVLISDCKGDEHDLQTIFDARPDVLNHNLETVLRLQRAVRPSASYACSLAVLARAKAAGLVTKSGIILGMGERTEEVVVALEDLAAIDLDIVTMGQYLRPSAAHVPVARYWSPDDFDEIRHTAQQMGFAHVEASPLTRSSYHARQALNAAEVVSESA
ncbi:MAG TPA: lipoyl synthase [Acidimicrobiales bacterium]